MEWKEGRDLNEAASESSQTILLVIRQLALFIDEVHAVGYLYLDLKPGNVRINGSRKISVIDFGSARSIAELSQEETPLHWNLGTKGYTAPERLARKMLGNTEPFALRESDLFSLGGIAYHLFEMEDPYDANREDAYFSGEIEKLIDQTLRFEFTPACLRPLLLRAMHEDPEQRFRSGMDFYQALKDAYVGHVMEGHKKGHVNSVLSFA